MTNAECRRERRYKTGSRRRRRGDAFRRRLTACPHSSFELRHSFVIGYFVMSFFRPSSLSGSAHFELSGGLAKGDTTCSSSSLAYRLEGISHAAAVVAGDRRADLAGSVRLPDRGDRRRRGRVGAGFVRDRDGSRGGLRVGLRSDAVCHGTGNGDVRVSTRLAAGLAPFVCGQGRLSARRASWPWRFCCGA